MSTNFEIKANEEITAPSIRLVHDNNTNVMSLSEALSIAENAELDLVQINDAEIPVCKVLDFNRYVYEQKQTEKKNVKKQKQTAIQLKEIQLSWTIQTHDLEIKAKAAKAFIEQNKHVQVSIKLFGGNESVIAPIAKSKINEFLTMIGEVTILQELKQNGKTLTITFKQKGL